MILFIDNFDSFTYNLVHDFQVLGHEVLILRNNARTVEECLALCPKAVVIGPGPGSPTDAGISLSIMQRFAGKTPILGVCLGHQCLAHLYGGKVRRGKKPVHGKTSRIYHQNRGVFQGIKQGFKATRYHSLVVDKASLPSCLEITAETSDGEIMGLRHREHFIEGIQFHPESIQTEYGLTLLNHFFQKGETLCLKNSSSL